VKQVRVNQRWFIYVMVATLSAVACVGYFLLSNQGRQILRSFKYEVLLGQPLINGVPRTPVDCATLLGARTVVLLAFGQSNAANYGRGRYRSKRAVYSFYANRCYRAIDPMPGADGGGGSVWSRLGDRLIEQGRADRVVIATIGVGNTELARWAPTGDLHARLIAVASELKAAGLAPTYLLWHQGELDRRIGTEPAAYRNDFLGMVTSLRQHKVLAPIYVAQATYCYGEDSPALRQVQFQLADAARAIRRGPDTDRFAASRYRYDDCHFSEEGLRAHAEAWLASLSAEAG